MNRLYCFLFMLIGIVIGHSFASDGVSVDGKNLEYGYYDVAKVAENGKFSISGWDSTSGIYLFVESGWDGPCCVSPYYTSFSIGKNLNSKQNDNIWVLTDFSGIDSLNLELKRGNPLSLDKFTKLEFDSTHVQYLLHGVRVNRPVDIKVKRDFLDTLKAYHPDSLEYLSEQEYMEYLASIDYINSLPEMYLLDYFLYQRENAVVALCGVAHSICYYLIGCFYQDNGSFVFDSLPNPRKMARAIGCPNSAGSSVRPLVRNSKKKNSVDDLYKVNGVPALKSSSNIIIQNKQPKLHLKGF